MPLLRINMIASSELKLLSHDPSYGVRPFCWVWFLQALACSKEAELSSTGCQEWIGVGGLPDKPWAEPAGRSQLSAEASERSTESGSAKAS